MTTKASGMTAKTATQNACKLCNPLGACLAFRGIESCVPFLHGSQGCATYIRRYLWVTALEIVEHDALVLPVAQPRENGHVGNRVTVAAHIVLLGKTLVQHAIKPIGFTHVALDGVVDLVGRIVAEVMILPGHGA